MASALKAFLWTAFFGIIAFFIHYETSTVTIKLREETYIKAKREEVYAILADVQKSSKFQPLVVGVTHLVKTINADDVEEVKYTLHQNISLLDGLYSEIVDIQAITTILQTGREIKTEAHVIDGTVIVQQRWFLEDYIFDNHLKGTLIIETTEMQTPRIFAKFVRELSTANRKMLSKNLKQHLEKNFPLEEEEE